MLSLPTKHALKAITSLAERGRSDFISVSDLAELADLPPSYLSKLVKQLAEAGVVLTRKGPSGGVGLPARKISLYEVCQALEDPIISETCFLSRKSCSATFPCPLHAEWAKERKRVHAFLHRNRL